MSNLFVTVLNMSLTGAFVIAAICFARVALKRAPKIISYCLWAVAGFRLIVPFSIESALSLIPFQANLIPSGVAVAHVRGGAQYVDGIAAPMQTWITVGFSIWAFGVAVMLVYGAATYFKLRHSVKGSVNIATNIYESESANAPLVLGFLSPKIYLPPGLSNQERRYIELHEQTHIRRCDHVIKLTAYIILALHWFNPLVWLAFFLMGTDMEMSCDERVLKKLGVKTKKDYSLVLLSLAVERRSICQSPLAFGGGNISARIKNILNLKQQSRAALGVLTGLLIVLSLGLSVNRAAVGVVDSGADEEAVHFEIFDVDCCDIELGGFWANFSFADDN